MWKSVALFAVSAVFHSCVGTDAVSGDVAEDNLRPEWIWADRTGGPTYSSTSQSVQLYRAFHLSLRPAAAQLRITADFAACEVRLNDRTIVVMDDFTSRLNLDVTGTLRTGENTIEFRAVGGHGPAAVAADLRADLIDGSTFLLRTGKDWKATVDHSGSTAKSFGAVTAEMWSSAARVTSFDDYEQWKQASGTAQGTDPARFQTMPGFDIQLVRSAAADEGSWISMAFDPQGRLTISREDKGLLRMTLSDNRTRVERVEMINDTLQECRGLLYAWDALYASANNSKGLYRLRDMTDDGQFDEVQLLRKFPGDVGHGRNDLALGPDGMIYSIHGDSVRVPAEEISDRTSPLREAARGQQTTEGHLIRTDHDGRRWELVAGGLRNPYGIDFNADGEAFTYDADAEFDMGAPWYRPTRIVHLVSGADFGWRGRTGNWPPFDPDHAAAALPVVDVGKGSPTAVKSGTASSFPVPWGDAMFALDWAYGRILACHLQPHGAGYVSRPVTFLKGRPFNVTDLTFGPDGSMYVITGGRKTQSALYRVNYIGQTVEPPRETRQQTARIRFAHEQRALRRKLEVFHGRADSGAIATAWPHLRSPDPVIRHAARIVVEHQPVDEWQDQALAEQEPRTAVTALLALALADRSALVPRILERLNEMPLDRLSTYDRFSLLHAYSICLAADQLPDSRTASLTRLNAWFPESKPAVAPIGAGRGVNRQLTALLHLYGHEATRRTMSLLNQSTTQEDRLHYLFVLRYSRTGWVPADRRAYFLALTEIERSATGGAGMPGFLQRIREEAVATLTDEERKSLGNLLQSGTETEPAALTIDRPIVGKWTVEMLAAGSNMAPDLRRGQKLFREALCSSCHRISGNGGVAGPDLTSVAGRFGRRDLLTSILTPSKVVAENYRNAQVVTTDGRVITGRVITGGDYRSTKLRIATDTLRPSLYVEIAKADIETHQLSSISPMPEGLLDRFSKDEIFDLLTFIESGGHALPVR